ncbi:DUF5990 family protein [Streptomyces sp. MS1.AVA.1]|uniref:DUF5990 family protein n=1 Tax=Streptomyces machairae TaxID=3134109 RepID=A0ABU8UV27_9ACTN
MRGAHSGPSRRPVHLPVRGTVSDSGTLTMFRRVKLLLDAVPVEVLDASAGTGLLVGRLGLTDVRGGPLCARVVPPHITWTAESADADD